MSEPRPADVLAGHWRDIEVPELGSWEPSERVSVVIDGDDPGLSGATVAGLREQSYPAELIEVIEPESSAEPSGSVVVLVAAGAVPDREFVEAHARWHHAVADAVSFGALEPAAEEPGQAVEPLELVCDLTRDLTDPMGGHHLAGAEGSVGVRGKLLGDAGGLAESRASGGTALARLDLAHRLHCAGAVFVAEPRARASGRPIGIAAAVAAACKDGESLELRMPQASALVALPPFREPGAARRHERAALAVNVDAGDAKPDEVLATLAGVLRGHMGDIEVRVQISDSHPAHARVAAAVAADPRASLGGSSLVDGTDAPFQATVPAVAIVDPRTIADLHELALREDAGALHVTVPGMRPQEAMIEVVATAAWRRASRLAEATGEDRAAILGRLYGERWVSGVEVSTRRHGIAEPQVTEHGPLAKATDLGHERNAHLRFRERAEDMAERAATQAQRTLTERLRAREERKAAERIEARLGE